MANNQTRSQDTQAAIMHAAFRLSAQKPIDSITIREICTEAGVSIGAFYHHFSGLIHEQLFEYHDVGFAVGECHNLASVAVAACRVYEYPVLRG